MVAVAGGAFGNELGDTEEELVRKIEERHGGGRDERGHAE